jgi:hypothetical protein
LKLGNIVGGRIASKCACACRGNKKKALHLQILLFFRVQCKDTLYNKYNKKSKLSFAMIEASWGFSF